ncbi:MAG: hypothetical protein V1746_06150 [bacterium]
MAQKELPMFIPKKTQSELVNPASKGHRHEQAKRIICSLVAQGLSEEAIFAELRSKYENDVTDSELCGLINWAKEQNFRPYQSKSKHWQAHRIHFPVRIGSAGNPAKTTPEKAVQNVERLLNGFRCNEADLWHVSPWHPSENWKLDALPLLAGLYYAEDCINVVWDCVEKEGKAHPIGAGKTLKRDEWFCHIRDGGVPEGKGGAWIRPNPVKPKGSGKGGACTDADVISCRFALLEFDDLPVNLQISLLAKLQLPIAAIVLSGGRSAHAWIKVDCKNGEQHSQTTNRLLTALASYGIDANNKNPSRMSRLPGAKRTIGAIGDGEQKLLFLNPEPTFESIF